MVAIVVKMHLDGHIDDLYALSLLFPEGAYPDLHIVTRITGTKAGTLDRAEDTNCRETYLTGDGCLPLTETQNIEEASWLALKIIAPLNGYAVLADSNFSPVIPTSVTYKNKYGSGGMIFGANTPNRPTRLITTNRHSLLNELLPSRVKFMSEYPLAAIAAAVIGGTPSWAEYYRLLEDLAGHRNTTLDKLPDVGLAQRQALDGFKKAANNRTLGRHGASKRDTSLNQTDLMNLLEAREFIRTVVATWLDSELGGRIPRDRVDGAELRFGLDSRSCS